jgi:hypothetical protein
MTAADACWRVALPRGTDFWLGWRHAAGEQPADPAAVQRYLAKAFGDHLDEVRQAMDELASRHEPAELNRIGFRLYEKFRPDVPYGNEVWGKRAVLDVELIRAAT